MPSGGSEFSRAWPVLAAATTAVGVGASSLPFYTAGLFMKPLHDQFGWTTAAISSANLALTLGIGFASPMIGRLVDRFGVRPVVVPALLIQALGFVALSFLQGAAVVFVSIAFAMGLLGAGSSPVAITRVVNGHFVRARGLALGLCLMGTGLAATIAPPLLALLIAAQGWRSGYLALAAVVVVAAPLALLLRPADSQVGAPAPVSSRGWPFLVSGRFWVLLAISALGAFGTAGIVVHFVPILIEKGATPLGAAGRAGAIGLAVLTARFVTGVALDRLPAAWVGGAVMAAAASSALLLHFGSIDVALGAAILLGFGLGAEVDLISYLCAKTFGLGSYGRVYGVIYGATLLAAGLGPLVLGLLADRTGNYAAAVLLSGLAMALSAALLFSLARPSASPSTALNAKS